MIENNAQLLQLLRSLVEAWCDRRCFNALRHILPAYPMASALTESWQELGIALENVRAFARNELTAPELASVNEAIQAIHARTGTIGPSARLSSGN